MYITISFGSIPQCMDVYPSVLLLFSHALLVVEPFPQVKGFDGCALRVPPQVRIADHACQYEAGAS